MNHTPRPITAVSVVRFREEAQEWVDSIVPLYLPALCKIIGETLSPCIFDIGMFDINPRGERVTTITFSVCIDEGVPGQDFAISHRLIVDIDEHGEYLPSFRTVAPAFEKALLEQVCKLAAECPEAAAPFLANIPAFVARAKTYNMEEVMLDVIGEAPVEKLLGMYHLLGVPIFPEMTGYGF